jgi:hypothetical protein
MDFEPGGPLEHSPGGPFTWRANPRGAEGFDSQPKRILLLLCLSVSNFFMQAFSVEEAMKDGNRRRPP